MSGIHGGAAVRRNLLRTRGRRSLLGATARRGSSRPWDRSASGPSGAGGNMRSRFGVWSGTGPAQRSQKSQRARMSRTYGKARPSPVKALRLVGAGARGSPRDGTTGQGQCHEAFVAHDDGVCVIAARFRRPCPRTIALMRSLQHANVRPLFQAKGLLRRWSAARIAPDAGWTSFRLVGRLPMRVRRLAASLIAQCFGDVECRISDSRLVKRTRFSVLAVLRAWIDPASKDPRTLHHGGRAKFMIARETIKLPSRVR